MERKPKLLISACLCGVPCRYDGNHNRIDDIEVLKTIFHLIPQCPEVLGGLDTPRMPAERSGFHVITADGMDVTKAFVEGAQCVLNIVLKEDCKIALMKSKSPSCGYQHIYDGHFTKTLTNGHGVTVEYLLEHNIAIYTETDIDQLIEKYT